MRQDAVTALPSLSAPRRRATSLRTRLVVAFFLVAAPPMLGAAYVAAQLMSRAFERNVAQWLAETSGFFKLEANEAANDARRAAEVIGRSLGEGGATDLKAFAADFALLGATGFDLLAVYRADGALAYASSAFTLRSKLPAEDASGLFRIDEAGAPRLMTGAWRHVGSQAQGGAILVGTWLDESYVSNVKAVSDLTLRLYAVEGAGFTPIAMSRPEDAGARARLDAFAPRLQKTTGAIYAPADEGEDHRAVYEALRDADGELVGALVVGLRRDQGFFAQIGALKLFVGILAFGAALSLLGGVAMSALLLRPLRQLSRGIREVAAGDLTQRASVVGGGRELEEMGAGFNAMTEKLAQMRAMEEELRRREGFAALGPAAMTIAHEIRNPLGVIKTSTDLVRRRAALTARDDKVMGYVIEEVRRIEGLLRDFLDFARPRPAQRSHVELRPIVERALAFTQPELSAAKIEATVVDDAPGARAWLDADQIHQACLNLTLNAIDAMPQGGRLTVRLTREGDALAFAFEDEGAGVPAGDRAGVFAPFLTTKAKGAGLGLAKVQAVAGAHGGRARCEAAPGGGARFVVTLATGEPHDAT